MQLRRGRTNMADDQDVLQSVPPPNVTMAPAYTPGSDISSATNQQVGPPQQPPQQVPQQGGMPLIARYIGGMIHPQSTGPLGGQGLSRGDMTLNFMGEFLSNLASGLANAGHGPGANLRGFAGGVQAPYQRSVQQYEMGQQQQAQQAQVQGEEARTQLTQAQAQQMQNVVQTPYGPMSQTLAAKVFPAAIAAQGKVEASQVQKQYMATPLGVFDTKKGEFTDGGGSPNGATKITQELADDWGLPKELVGKVFPNSQVSGLMRGASSQEATVQGSAGPALVNKVTGKTRSLGLGAPSMGGLTIVSGPDGPQYVPKAQAIGQTPGTALTANDRVKINVNDGALTNAIPRVQNILDNVDTVASMIDSGRISFSIGADGVMQAAVGRGVSLTPKEAKFAADFQTMSEDINLLRGPMGATGFRSQEAFQALQAQRGRLAQNPAVFKGVLQNTLQAFNKLHEVNTNALKTAAGSGPKGPASSSADPFTQFGGKAHPTTP